MEVHESSGTSIQFPYVVAFVFQATVNRIVYMLGFFQSSYQKIRSALTRTRSLFTYKLKKLLGQPWKEETFEELEQTFFEADLGAACAAEMAGHARDYLFSHPHATSHEILGALEKYALDVLNAPPKIAAKAPRAGDPLVILIAGVNGSGKTTSIAKLAKHFKEEEGK